MKCQNCGSNINQGEMFCKTCGAGINNQMQANNSFFSQTMNQEIINQTINVGINDNDLIDAYIGKAANKLKEGFSWSTLLWGLMCIWYRKMWSLGFVWILISIGIDGIMYVAGTIWPYEILLNITISFALSIILNVIMAFKFKGLYLKKVSKEVEKIKLENPEKTREELIEICSKKGGTTIFGIILGFVIPEIIANIL